MRRFMVTAFRLFEDPISILDFFDLLANALEEYLSRSGLGAGAFRSPSQARAVCKPCIPRLPKQPAELPPS
jgi:hypothetical protein